MRRKQRLFLAVTWIIVFAILPLPLVALLDKGLVDSAWHILAADLGLAAYVWWLAALALATRPRWLEQLIGLPSLYFLHGILGVAALLAAGLHVLFSTTFHPSIRGTGMWAWYIELVSVIYAIVFLSGWLVDRLSWARKMKRALNRVFTHEVTMWIHRLNLVAILLITIHVSIIPRVASLTAFMTLFYLYTALAFGSYLWARLVAPALPRRQAKVSGNTVLNPTTRRIDLTLPAGSEQPVPGCYYFVSFQGVPGFSRAAHPYSISGIDSSTRTVSMTIHASGDLTSRIGRVPVGLKAVVEGPFGLFNRQIAQSRAKTLVFIGMGAGIAPLRSLAQTWVGKRKIIVENVVSRKEDLYYQADFEALHVVDYRPHLHRLHQEDANKLVSDAGKNALYVVVGPPTGVIGTEKLLHHAGIARKNIVDERLTL